MNDTRDYSDQYDEFVDPPFEQPEPEAPKTNGKVHSVAPIPLPFVNMAHWDDESAPPREWAVLDRVPKRQVSLLTSQGAGGKTTLELQRGVAHVIARDWIGTLPEIGPAIFLNAEDDERELHFRLDQICKHYSVSFADLVRGGFHLLAFAEHDPILFHVDKRTGLLVPTPLFNRLAEAVFDIKPVAVMIDTVADTFGGNENDRTHVRQFVSSMRRLAIKADTSIRLCAHPSLTGINSGSGLSGITGWHNSVRAREYLHDAETDAGEVPDPDLRMLEMLKSNQGRKADTILLRWRNGVYIREQCEGSLDAMAADQRADDVFLQILRRFDTEGRNASHNSGRSYAPSLMVDEPEAKAAKLSKKRLVEAMRRLFVAKMIEVENYGKPSRPLSRLEICRR